MTNTPWNGELQYTKHATEVMKQRAISREWVESVLASPRERTQDPHDPDVERFFGPIPERNSRALRVAVNTRAVPWRLVSVFFDRSWRRK